MTLGQIMVGMMIAMALFQVLAFWNWRVAGRIEMRGFWLMALGAFVPPVLAYLALYLVWPDIGALEFSN